MGDCLTVWSSLVRLCIGDMWFLGCLLTSFVHRGTARQARANMKPFGGIQIIAVGDFYQLPPVEDHFRFCFQAYTWDKCFREHSFVLEKPYRQESDELFVRCERLLTDGADMSF